VTDSQFRESVPVLQSRFSKHYYCVQKTAFEVAAKSFGGAEKLRAELKKRYDAAHERYQARLSAWKSRAPKTSARPQRPKNKRELEMPSQALVNRNGTCVVWAHSAPQNATNTHFCLLYAAGVLFHVAPFYWWEVCGVDKPPQVASKGEAFERAVVQAGIEVLDSVPEKEAIALSPAQFREAVERKMSKSFFLLPLCVFDDCHLTGSLGAQSCLQTCLWRKRVCSINCKPIGTKQSRRMHHFGPKIRVKCL